MSGSVPCPGCGRPVPPDRLACPACGTLVASVRSAALAPAEAAVTAAPEPEAEPGVAPEPEADSKPGVVAGPAPEASVTGGIAPGGIGSGGIVPGAYLPPTGVWPPPATAPPAAAAPSGAPPANPPPTPGRASILADLPFDAPDDIEGWLVALGGVVTILGFFLPWRSSFLGGFDGYFDTWGLGIGAHLPIFVLVLVTTALAILPNRIAAWVRTGAAGTVTGGIVFGLVWLYLEGGSSPLGALLSAVGAILLIAGGVIAVAPGRSSHPGDEA